MIIIKWVIIYLVHWMQSRFQLIYIETHFFFHTFSSLLTFSGISNVISDLPTDINLASWHWFGWHGHNCPVSYSEGLLHKPWDSGYPDWDFSEFCVVLAGKCRSGTRIEWGPLLCESFQFNRHLFHSCRYVPWAPGSALESTGFNDPFALSYTLWQNNAGNALLPTFSSRL